MKTTILTLDEHDDRLSIRDKISGCRSNRILLVLPRSQRVFREKLELIMVQRHAVRLGAQLGLVTVDEQIAVNAFELGIAVFDDEKSAQQKPWRRPRRDLAGVEKRHKIHTLPKRERSVAENFRSGARSLPVFLRGAIFLIGLVSVFLLAGYLLPGGVIRLSPLEEEQTLKLEVWASPKVTGPTVTGAVPARVATVVVSHQESGTPSQITRVPDQPARGLVTIENITDQDVTVPQGTIVLTLSTPPIRFRTLETITVPAGEDPQVTTAIEAVQAGSTGNVAAQSIGAMEGLAGLRLKVFNAEETSGGTDRESPAPSAADFEMLKHKSEQTLKKLALESFQAQLEPGEKLLPDTLVQSKRMNEKLDPPVGQAGDRINLSVEAEYSIWIVQESDVRVVTESAMDAVLKSGYQPVANSLFVSDLGQPRMDESRIKWEMFGVRKITPQIPREAVLLAVSGRSKTEAAATLARIFQLKAPPAIDLFPAWWKRMPFFEQRIRVEVQ